MIVEVFSCSGGMAEGLRRAGLEPDLAFDYDTDACDSYEQNLGKRPIQIDARDLLRMSTSGGWSLRDGVELLVCDPPCTPWSRAGKRKGQADERDMLALTVELIRRWRPRFWLIANVPGLDDGPNLPTVQKTIGGLTRDGYCIDFARLDAADYGVPQHRVRPFWYGHGAAFPCLQWPERTHGSPGECRNGTLDYVRALRPWVTCRQALSHLSPKDLGTPVRLRWRGCQGHQIASVPDKPARVVGTSNLSDGNVLAHPTDAVRPARANRAGRKPRASHIDEPAGVVCAKATRGDGSVLFDGPNHRPSRADAPARALTRNTHGDGALLCNDKHPVNTLDAPSFTVTMKGDARGAQGACVLAYDGHPISRSDEPGHVVPSSQPGNGGAVIEWPRDRPATTIQSGDRMAPPGHHDKSFLTDNRGHGPNAIKLSEKAAAILQGFPPGWVFSGATKRARWAQLGMAMPPPLGRGSRAIDRPGDAAAHPEGGWRMSLALVPIDLKDACAFVSAHHRHHAPPRGCILVAGAADDGKVVGVVVIGRPVSRMLQDGYTAEVIRLATDGSRNACSFLYGAAWRACRALGYRRLVTYTLPEEGGASLRAAGWRLLGQAGGGSWSRPSRPRVDRAPTQVKMCWEAPESGARKAVSA